MSVKRPGFLCIPAYVVGATAAAASASLLPPIIGVPIGGVIAIILLTPISLLHQLRFEIEGNLVIYALATIASLTFACHFISPDFGPAAMLDVSSGTKFSWIQVAFIALQQACYFGIHAFTEDYR